MTDEEAEFLRTISVNGVARDWIDLRDTLYEPSLQTLLARQAPDDALFVSSPIATNRRSLCFGIRDQGDSGRCVGHALAALVDLQRLQQCPEDDLPTENGCASADMLYCMARFHDRFTLRNGRIDGTSDRTPGEPAVALNPQRGGVRSLRSVVKGLYHHGVFIDRSCGPTLCWESAQDLPTRAQVEAARSTSLGAYYRLQPLLNHYHAALNDTGTVLVSATTHEGWLPSRVRENQGVIPWTDETGQGTQHAFVIVGYTRDGFLILNSWGRLWGGYAIDGTHRHDGIALWKYGDWARNVVDGWVLRLGVSAPDAFDVSIGEQGLAQAFGSIRAGSTPCLELMGHYIHLDDGLYTELSPYPSNRNMIEETLRLLPEMLSNDGTAQVTPASATADARVAARGTVDQDVSSTGLLLWISGSLEGMKLSFETAVRRKQRSKGVRLYPFFVFWCNDFVEDSIKFLLGEFSSSTRISGNHARHRDQLIESAVQGTGRAFWREVERCARRSIWGAIDPEQESSLRNTQRGILGAFLKDLYDRLSELDADIHIVAEGAGALVLDEMIRQFECRDELEQGELVRKIATINLALPAIDMTLARKRIIPLLEALNSNARKTIREQGGHSDGEHHAPPGGIHVPSADLERCVHNGDYGKTVLHLIANAFEDREQAAGGESHCLQRREDGHPKTMLGMAAAHERYLAGRIQAACPNDPFVVHGALESQPDASGRISQVQLSRDKCIEDSIFESIRRHCPIVSRRPPATRRSSSSTWSVA